MKLKIYYVQLLLLKQSATEMDIAMKNRHTQPHNAYTDTDSTREGIELGGTQ